jgi:hypothetical protein
MQAMLQSESSYLRLKKAAFSKPWLAGALFRGKVSPWEKLSKNVFILNAGGFFDLHQAAFFDILKGIVYMDSFKTTKVLF